MPAKKKEKPLTLESIKDALLPSIADLFKQQNVQNDKRFQKIDEQFQSVGEQFKYMESKFDKKLTVLKGEIVQEVKILLDNDKRLDSVMDSARVAADNTIAVKDHSQRIEKLEVEVGAIKGVVKSPNA